ncbi:MAG: FapA family protein [Lachnospiraceae bacterium]|nr:FapA family protein [Lachnospiraceae bacterium]
MANFSNRLFQLNITDDCMMAIMTIEPENPQEEYTLADAQNFLLTSNVRMGVDKDKLEHMITEKRVGEPFTVAMGKPFSDGVDGSYEYFFDINPGVHPKEEEDGSVDFLNTTLFVEVKAGDMIAKYTPATVGEFGFNVEGKLLQPKRGKELKPLHGKGVEKGEDGVTYYAGITGKIEYKYGNVEISEIYDHHGDLNMSSSNIRFSGDVHIHGDVASGMLIDALGCVEIDGHVGGAMIKAGKDVVLKRGVQGRGRAKIEAGGDVFGQFFEDAIVTCHGNLDANYLMNTNANAGGKVMIHGKKGLIVGGHVHGVMGVEASTIGNEKELLTEVSAGIETRILVQYEEISKEVNKLSEEIVILTGGIDKLMKMKQVNPQSFDSDSLSKMMQAKILKTNQKKKGEEQLSDLSNLMNSSEHVWIGVHSVANPGVKIHIGSVTKKLMTRYTNTRFSLNAEEEFEIAPLD